MSLDPTEVTLSAIFPIFGSIWIGFGLGIFKRLAQAEQRASPRIVTAYLFYVTLALVMITPYLKYPSLANQIIEIAGNDETLMNERSTYFTEDRAYRVLSYFALGLVFSIGAFSICNALQHASIK